MCVFACVSVCLHAGLTHRLAVTGDQLRLCDVTTAHDLSLISTLHRTALIWINAAS